MNARTVATASPSIDEQLVRVSTAGVTLEGDLSVPAGATGIVLFAHGSGSSRFSSRNRYVAQFLRETGLGTLLIDLLTAPEEAIDDRTRHLRFDIEMLGERLVGAAEWLSQNATTRNLRIGMFGASTGAGAALVAAAEKPKLVAAVVSRGGRPDLAGSALPHVQAPTLLIVGSRDTPVIEMNQTAYDLMTCERRFEIVPGATHLFEEPGTLEIAARLARDWFMRYLGGAEERRS
jgi:putative phosphoribosyl transferase